MEITKILPKTGKFIHKIGETDHEKANHFLCVVIQRMIALDSSFIAMSDERKGVFDGEALEHLKKLDIPKGQYAR